MSTQILVIPIQGDPSLRWQWLGNTKQSELKRCMHVPGYLRSYLSVEHDCALPGDVLSERTLMGFEMRRQPEWAVNYQPWKETTIFCVFGTIFSVILSHQCIVGLRFGF